MSTKGHDTQTPPIPLSHTWNASSSASTLSSCVSAPLLPSRCSVMHAWRGEGERGRGGVQQVRGAGGGGEGRRWCGDGGRKGDGSSVMHA